MHDCPASLLKPACLPLSHLAGTQQSPVEGIERPGTGLPLIELVMAHDPQRGFVVDLKVRKIGIAYVLTAQRTKQGAKPANAGVDFSERGLVRWSGRRRSVILSVGRSLNGQQQHEGQQVARNVHPGSCPFWTR